MYSKIQNDSLKIDIKRHYDLWNSETTIKYVNVLNRWRASLRRQGALIYDVETFENPISLLTESPEATAVLKEVMFESIWQGHLIQSTIDFIDQSVLRMEREITRTE